MVAEVQSDTHLQSGLVGIWKNFLNNEMGLSCLRKKNFEVEILYNIMLLSIYMFNFDTLSVMAKIFNLYEISMFRDSLSDMHMSKEL